VVVVERRVRSGERRNTIWGGNGRKRERGWGAVPERSNVDRSAGSVDSTAVSVDKTGLGRPSGTRGGASLLFGPRPTPVPLPAAAATSAAKEKAEGASQGEGRARPSTYHES